MAALPQPVEEQAKRLQIACDGARIQGRQFDIEMQAEGIQRGMPGAAGPGAPQLGHQLIDHGQFVEGNGRGDDFKRDHLLGNRGKQALR